MANPWSDRDDKARLSPNYQVLTMSNKAIFKILVGVAWIDGQVQPEERQHLQELIWGPKPVTIGLRTIGPIDCLKR
jgi:hypothetical protein